MALTEKSTSFYCFYMWINVSTKRRKKMCQYHMENMKKNVFHTLF